MNSSLEKWEAIRHEPAVVRFFAGLFDRVGVEISDTGETLTVAHTGDRLVLSPGIERAAVDYCVTIRAEQVERLAEHARRGDFDALEQFRIVSALFTPATASMMRNPVISHPTLRVLSGAETLIHVHLLSPSAEEPSIAHTLIYVAKQWLVWSGEHGFPRRVYMLNVEEALRYQRRFFKALKANNLLGWMNFSSWYRQWRTTVSADTA